MDLILNLALVFIIFLCSSSVSNAQGDSQFSEWGRSSRLANPGSALGQPFAAPVFLGAHFAYGGAFQYDQGNTGYGMEFIIRPGAAVKYLDFLYRRNVGVVLQADYQNIGLNRRILSANFILRKYLAKTCDNKRTLVPFIGFGFGASEITLQPPDGSGRDRYWNGILEGGLEWVIRQRLIIYGKLQYCYYNYHDVDYSNWSAMVGAGIPLPW